MQASDKANQTDAVRCLDLVHQPLHQPLDSWNYDRTAYARGHAEGHNAVQVFTNCFTRR